MGHFVKSGFGYGAGKFLYARVFGWRAISNGWDQIPQEIMVLQVIQMGQRVST
jgi:hypothetical protein